MWNDGEYSDPYEEWFHENRFLAEKEAVRIDYSVLSVGVMTLGLIMVVEVARHRIDHSAHGRPFFKAVLEGVYAELTTLGIVEFFLHVLAEYHENLDKAKKTVFADVHFALFYTAILNACQAGLLAFVATRVSQRIWVKTELLELNHYVEIREEFDEVKRQLEAVHAIKGQSGEASSSTTSEEQDDPGKSSSRRHVAHELLENPFEFSRRGLASAWKGLVDRIKYPHLLSKYNDLLVQVRFHELRVHFLQAYNLPLQLKISDYLIRSEQAVLIKLVHISTVAWLLLTGAMNVLYYCLGLLAYKSEDTQMVGTAFTWIFFGAMTLFILVSLAVYNKMTSIFRSIMHEKTLWDVHNVEEEADRLAAQQMALFWGGDPKFVIGAIQFMQFGYALALSLVIVFWEEINDGDVGMHWFVIMISGCYTIFTIVTAQVIPRYTLCTSLGQLVDEKRLHETVAVFRLEEAKRRLLIEEEEKQYEEMFHRSLEPATQPKPGRSNVVTRGASAGIKVVTGVTGAVVRTARSGVKTAVKGVADIISPETADSVSVSTGSNSATPNGGVLMADLVKLDTASLRGNLPESERQILSERSEGRRARGVRRKKTMSDGVAAMSMLRRSSQGSTGSGENKGLRAVDDMALRPRRVSSKNSLPKTDSKGELDVLKAEDTDEAALRARRRSRRVRNKSVSDGVALMASMTSSRQDVSAFDRVPEETTIVFEKMDNGPTHDFSPGLDLDDDESVAKDQVTMTATGPMPSELMNQDVPGQSDDVSVGSTRSEAGFSDVDDVPEVHPSMLIKHAHESPAEVPLQWRMRSYFQSRRYIVISNVFGTMVCFFFVGQRLERFLHTEGIVTDKFVSFDFAHEYTFWLLTTWLGMFLIKSALVMWSLDAYNTPNNFKARETLVAAVLDTILTGGCLAVLFYAESRRCCYPEEEESPSYLRYLAGEDDYGYGAVEYGPAPCACERFGSRLYTGLGRVEPFTSLIALRIFRHWLARKIVSAMYTRRGWEQESAEKVTSNLDPFDVFTEQKQAAKDDGHGHDAHGGHGGHGGEDHGTITELWQAAIGKYPEIVEKHGEFSGELLKAMLGVASPSTHEEHKSEHPAGSDKSVGSNSARKAFTLDTAEYNGLSAEAQEIIMAGKLGAPVKHARGMAPTSLGLEETIHEGQTFDATGVPIPTTQQLVFEVDTNAAPSEMMFTSPNSRLVRSMRRCERKLLPFSDHWTVCDVVVTRFEIVYFDATDVDLPDAATDANHQALMATKGGKGLRLCDVAKGRRVVGRLQFTEIQSVSVERIMSGEDDENSPADGTEVERVEFWMNSVHETAGSRRPRSEEWNMIKQDRLVVETTDGATLYLRFFSDLEEAAVHLDRVKTENEVTGPLFKDNALQWAQTLGRFCGPEQLRQALPHFGDDTDDELRDYLVIRHFPTEGDINVGGRGHRRQPSNNLRKHHRISSVGDMLALAQQVQDKSGNESRHSSPGRRASALDSMTSRFRRSISDVEGATPPPAMPKPAKLSSRAKSDGAKPEVQRIDPGWLARPSAHPDIPEEHGGADIV